MKNNFMIKIAISGLMLLLLAACGGLKFNMYTPQDDVLLGQQLDVEIRNNPVEYPIYNNFEIRKYLQDMVNEIIKSPHIKYRDVFAYKIEVIDKADVVNAFCTPGGYIYVYTGLLKFIDDEATLAAVLAHEIGHAECRHATTRMTTAFGMQALTEAYLEKNDNEASKMVTNLFSGMALLNNSREDEYEADERSFRYLMSTRWYPGAIKNFFIRIIGSTGSQGSSFEQMLSTHPLPKERLTKVTDYMKLSNLAPPSEENLFYANFQKIKKKMEVL
jgi:beta-barrel assembly-enhancing protease